jgi:phage shock protein C
MKKQLYRIPSQGKIAGVCAGVAEYTGAEIWLIRVIWLSGFLLSGGFFLIAYVACWFILDSRSAVFSNKSHSTNGEHSKDQWQRFDTSHDIDQAVEIKTKVWQAGEPPRRAYKDILSQFQSIEGRVREMESYVTSNEFTLKREISRL